VKTHRIWLATGSRPAVVDLTDEAAALVAGEGDGLLTAFAPHATAGVAVMEMGAGSEQDLVDHLARLFPRDDHWRHRHGSPGHGGDHVVPAFISPSVTVPVIGGELQLGTWQSIVLVDPNPDNPERSVLLTFVGG